MSRTTVRFSPALLALVATCAIDCKGVEDALEVNLEVACIDYGVDGSQDDTPFNLTVGTSKLDSCIYRRQDKTLNLWLRSADDTSALDLFVAGFAGAATYKTGGAEDGATMISIRTPDGDVDTNAVNAEDPAFVCEITVTDTDLPDVPLESGSAAGVGHVVIDVSCPKIGGTQIGRVDCDVKPTTFHLAVAECGASTE